MRWKLRVEGRTALPIFIYTITCKTKEKDPDPDKGFPAVTNK